MSDGGRTNTAAGPALDWDRIALVVFDMDGTLYDARRLRWRMAAWLLAESLRRRSLALPRTLAAFRRMREALASTTISRDYLGVLLDSMSDAVLVAAPDGALGVLRSDMRVLKRGDELLEYTPEILAFRALDTRGGILELEVRFAALDVEG